MKKNNILRTFILVFVFLASIINISIVNAETSELINYESNETIVSSINYIAERHSGSMMEINDVFSYQIKIKNNTWDTIEDISFKDILPNEVDYLESSILKLYDEYGYVAIGYPTYNSKDHSVTYEIPRLAMQEQILVQIQVRAIKYTETGLVNSYKITGEDISLQETKIVPMSGATEVISASMTSSMADKLVSPSQEIIYTIVISNTGEATRMIRIENELPAGLRYNGNFLHYQDGGIYESGVNNDDSFYYETSISPGDIVKIELQTVVEDLPKNINVRELKLFSTISAGYYSGTEYSPIWNTTSTAITNSVWHTVSEETSLEKVEIVLTDTNTGIILNSSENVISNNTQLIVKYLEDDDTYNNANLILGDGINQFKIYDIRLMFNESFIQPTGNVTVSIPIPNNYNSEQCKVYYISEDGIKTDMNARIENNYLVFETDHFSMYTIAETIESDTPYGEFCYGCGDVNLDGDISIKDVTSIQRNLADLECFDDSQKQIADVTGDGELSINDATLIQRYLADYIDKFPGENDSIKFILPIS